MVPPHRPGTPRGVSPSSPLHRGVGPGGSPSPPRRGRRPRAARAAFRSRPLRTQRPRGEVAGPEPEGERRLLRVGEEKDVVAGGFGVEVDPRPTGEADPLNERSFPVADEDDERAPRLRVPELDVDLAGGGGEPDLEPDRRLRFENEEPRKVSKGGRHGLPTTAGQKAVTRDGEGFRRGRGGARGPPGRGADRPPPRFKAEIAKIPRDYSCPLRRRRATLRARSP